jgi:serine-type D-Ala-D-Ala carboxypeptidase (penicillin-binding protein 5/6)
VSKSPFLTPGSPRSRRGVRRRSQRRAFAGSTFTLAIATVAALTIATGAFDAHGRDDGGAGTPTRTPHSQKITMPHASRSRTGLRLGTPPLRLAMAGGRGEVHAPFRRPPRAGLLFDLDSGRVLWARRPTRVLPIASLAKMMTALLVVRSRAADTPVRIARKAVDAAGSKVGLLPLRKRVRLETLLYGLLLPSGNDAAVALAEAVAGSVPRFVELMNAEAAKLGLSCTRYTSPDGLDDGNSSCASDLAELAHVDLEQPRLAAVARSASAIVPLPIKGGKLYLYNNNPLLRYGYPGATGLKTGETEAAGLCLVGTAERHGVRLGVVLLHSPELGRQAEYLLDRGFEQGYGQARISAPPVPAGR